MNNNKVPVFDFRVVNNYARLKDKATYLNADEDFNTRHLKENNQMAEQKANTREFIKEQIDNGGRQSFMASLKCIYCKRFYVPTPGDRCAMCEIEFKAIVQAINRRYVNAYLTLAKDE